ncbi:MAG: alpha-amylase family glycosyl hydrolase [Acidobacteriota bacterium]|nr:alpha-amylase family glycosyl hydrolase [Blastocatellia bacterium]MDW8239358.1 alpha-amylase family glycosyl hydrolase [Acidobacteriota bacterium]
MERFIALCVLLSCALGLGVCHAPINAQRSTGGAPSVVLQWFETSYRDLQRRLPEVVQMGYGAIYLPPPNKAGSGAASVGYDPADRFDFGDRLGYGTVSTRYGTAQELLDLVKAAHQLGLEVYFDTVMNHNANRGVTRISGYPDLIPQDFHIRSNTDTSNCEIRNFVPLSAEIFNCDLLGLADIAQEDGNNISGPLDPPGPIGLNEFGKPTYVRHPLTPQYYPDGRPVSEDVRQFLHRWAWFMGAVIGADGYRLDAVKHTIPAFFGGPAEQVGGRMSGPPFLEGLHRGVRARTGRDAVIFGENLSADARELATYAQTGMALLDYPLYFTLNRVFNTAIGDQSIGFWLGNPPRLDQGIRFAYGGLDPRIGFTFVQNHDVLPPRANNLAHAWVLTRPGRPIVYFDGNNIPDDARTNFPRPGRTDALGEGSNLLRALIDFHNEFARGDIVVRATEEGADDDVFVFERVVEGKGLALVALNDLADSNDAEQVTVTTSFPPGTVLVDYGGQMPPVTVGSDRRVTIRVPSNNNPADDPPGQIRFDNNGRGFVLYGPRNPGGPPDGSHPVRLEQQGVVLPLQPFPTADGRFADPEPNTRVHAPVVRADVITLRLCTDGTAADVVVQIDGAALPLAGRSPIAGSPEGLADGFVRADALGAGQFLLPDVDLSSLNEGWHVVKFLAFGAPGDGVAPVFNTFTQIFLLDRPDRSEHVTDGNIVGDFSAEPIAVQMVDPGPLNGQNELNALLVEADRTNLYIGLSAIVQGPHATGVVLFIDVDYGRATGLRELGRIDDDSGPATRLISSTEITAPDERFGAEFVVATLGGAGLCSAPAAPIRSGAATAPPVAARAGLYRINLSELRDLVELAAEIAFDPEYVAMRGPVAVNPPTGAVTDGLEIAIPWTALFADGRVPPDARLALFAYITYGGESGQLTSPSSPDRIEFGGRYPAEVFPTNQRLFGVVPSTIFVHE